MLCVCGLEVQTVRSVLVWGCLTAFFKPGACSLWLCAPGFLKLLWFARRYVCVSVCPPRGH